MSYTMEYFETDKDIDTSQVAVFGHSQHDKATPWTGATDQQYVKFANKWFK